MYFSALLFTAIASVATARRTHMHMPPFGGEENKCYRSEDDRMMGQMHSRPLMKAVESMEMDSFMGRWYEVMSNKMTTGRRGGQMTKCPTVDFFHGPFNKLEVVHSGLISDMMFQTDFEIEYNPSQPAMMKTQFTGFQQAMIVKLGPKHSRGSSKQYEYVVISEPSGNGLMVLARDVQSFNSQYKQEVMMSLQHLGFQSHQSTWSHGSSYLKTPFELFQSPSCNYAPQPPRPLMDYNLESMTGRWYIMYMSLVEEMSMPFGAKCLMGDNKKIGKNKFQCNKYLQIGDSVTQTERVIYEIPDLTRKGEILQRTMTQYGVMEEINSLPSMLINLGPEREGEYQYAIFSDALRQRMIVMARDVNKFDENHKAEVLRFLDDEHFMDTTLTQPIRVNHRNCLYQKQ